MQDKKQESSFFNNAASADSWNWMDKYCQDMVFKLFLGLVKPKQNECILDMGCGCGSELYPELVNRGLTVNGIDISKESIKIAKDKYPGSIFFEGDIENTQFKDDSFDIIMFSTVLHHIPDINNVLKESYRILRKGGRIYAFDPNYYNPFMWAYRSEQSPLRSRKNYSVNEKLLKKDELHRGLVESKYSNIKIFAKSGFTYSEGYFKRLLPFPLYKVVHFYNVIEKLLVLTKKEGKIGSFIISYAEK
jgi:ubiquinone/menaquinone biosynthesis C-methylase UbiE